jgi:hypothetical protein
MSENQSEEVKLAVLESRMARVETSLSDLSAIKCNVELIAQKLSNFDPSNIAANNVILSQHTKDIQDIRDDVKSIGKRVLMWSGAIVVIGVIITSLAMPYFAQKWAINESEQITEAQSHNH